MMPKLMFIGWKSPTLPPEMYSRQCAYRGLLREVHALKPKHARGGLYADEHARRRGFDIPLHTGHLPGKAYPLV